MTNEHKMEWFRGAHYGLFIHWGLYAELGGIWKQQRIAYGAEWIMRNAKIPLQDYKKLADTFNPTEFDAQKWVEHAKAWGMKYIVFTAKHHDGFSMFDTACSDYNIMNTPYGRDIVAELAEACRACGMKLCLYYSQMQDWEDPNGNGNEWDFACNNEKSFAVYFQNKVKPQVKELLTKYGDIGLLWFDTPYDMPRDLCQELADWVRQWQPDCIINGRIGYGIGDYRQMGDNEIPVLIYKDDWETPFTLNHSWGFASEDNEWKTPQTVIDMLVNVTGRGGNLLLNIGPDGKGHIPQESVAILDTVGAWLRTNGESIYDTRAAIDLPYQTRWGGLTAAPGKLFMHILRYPSFPYEICVCAFQTKVTRAYLLATGKEIQVIQSYEIARDEYRLRVQLPPPSKEAEIDLVVCLEIEDELSVRSLYALDEKDALGCR